MGFRSFDNVDWKVAEAEFFLEKVKDSDDPAEANFYFSAFVSASRSITFTLQAVMNDTEGFDPWYSNWQKILKVHALAPFFRNLRNDITKTGLVAITEGCATHVDGKIQYFHFFSQELNSKLKLQGASKDVAKYCDGYFRILLEMIYDCYRSFGPLIDPDVYYTLENLLRLEVSVEDLEENLGLPRGWTDCDDSLWLELNTEEKIKLRLSFLRKTIPVSEIKFLFQKYDIEKAN